MTFIFSRNSQEYKYFLKNFLNIVSKFMLQSPSLAYFGEFECLVKMPQKYDASRHKIKLLLSLSGHKLQCYGFYDYKAGTS